MRTARLGPLVVLAVAVLMGGGCTINRDIMFKTPLGYQFDSVPDTVDLAFKIQPNDYLQFRLFANDGFKMIDMVSIGTGADNARNMQRLQFIYLVEPDGNVKLPLLGRVTLSGKTLREAETWLEQRYMEFYNRPFVQLFINNRRVVVFPGGGGDAKIIPLENTNTTLMEAIASAGGLNKRADARKIKQIGRAHV